MESKSGRRLNRRQFLQAAGPAVALGASKWGRATGAGSNRITMGIIGFGTAGVIGTKEFLSHPDCRVLAVCDLDREHLRAGVNCVNQHYGNSDCMEFRDYRELLIRREIDAVLIAVPDHWHAVIATEAARRRKDIYGEIPLAHTISEQRAIVKAVQENGVIFQAGSWQRSMPKRRRAAEIVRSGLIGIVSRVEIGIPGGYEDFSGAAAALLQRVLSPEKIESPAQIVPGSAAWQSALSQPPPDLDYDDWIGPARMEPYISARVHENWRWNYNTGGGRLMQWMGHYGDIAHWGLGFDLTGPSEVEAHGQSPPRDAVWNTAKSAVVECLYRREVTHHAGDVKMTIAVGQPGIRPGVKWIGPDGWVWANLDGAEASNPMWLKGDSPPGNLLKVRLYESHDHRRNFLDCVKLRKPPVSPVETAHRSTIPGHLGVISLAIGRRIQWNPDTEEIVNDPDACGLLTRPYRPPWTLDWSNKFALANCSS
jgi:predicted dehydrogenase